MNQQIKTSLGVIIILIIATTAGMFIWLSQKNNPIEAEIQTAKTNPIKNQKIESSPAQTNAIVLDRKVLENAVYNTVNTNARVKRWDKKIEIGAIDQSQKAAKGYWWATDKWEWIAWQKDDDEWAILVSTDGFNCKELESIPSQYNDFFHDSIYPPGFKNKERYCY